VFITNSVGCNGHLDLLERKGEFVAMCFRPYGPLYDLVTRIELHLSLPAFTNCSLDHIPGDGDHDNAEKGGGINIHQRWGPSNAE